MFQVPRGAASVNGKMKFGVNPATSAQVAVLPLFDRPEALPPLLPLLLPLLPPQPAAVSAAAATSAIPASRLRDLSGLCRPKGRTIASPHHSWPVSNHLR